MDRHELVNVLGEHGIDVPDRCADCPRLGKLVAKLSLAQDNKTFLIAATDSEVLAASVRAQLTVQAREHYPNASDEQIADLVENSFASFIDSDKYPEALKNAGSILEAEDARIEASLEQATNLLYTCPPEGCDLALPEIVEKLGY